MEQQSLGDSTCLQHSLLNILSQLLRPTAQEKKNSSLKILVLTDDGYGFDVDVQ